MLPKIFADLWIHRENGIRAKHKMKKSWVGVSIEILQNLTVIGRSLSDETGNRVIVPQGVIQTISQGWKI